MTKIQINGVTVDVSKDSLNEAAFDVNSSGRRFRLLTPDNKVCTFTYNEMIAAVLDIEGAESKDKVELLRTVIQIREKGYEEGYDRTWPLIDKVKLALRRAWGAMRQAWLVHRAESVIASTPVVKGLVSHSVATATVTKHTADPIIKELEGKANCYFIRDDTDGLPPGGQGYDSNHFQEFLKNCSDDLPTILVVIRDYTNEKLPSIAEPKKRLFGKCIFHYQFQVNAKATLQLDGEHNQAAWTSLQKTCLEWSKDDVKKDGWFSGWD